MEFFTPRSEEGVACVVDGLRGGRSSQIVKGQLMTDGTMPAEDPFTAEMSDGLIWIEWVASTTVTDDEALSLVSRADALCPDVCAPMLVMLNDMVSLSRGALQIFAHRLNIAAMALVGRSAVDRLLVSYFAEVHNPPYPTRHFDTVDEARTWLTTHPHAG